MNKLIISLMAAILFSGLAIGSADASIFDDQLIIASYSGGESDNGEGEGEGEGEGDSGEGEGDSGEGEGGDRGGESPFTHADDMISKGAPDCVNNPAIDCEPTTFKQSRGK